MSLILTNMMNIDMINLIRQYDNIYKIFDYIQNNINLEKIQNSDIISHKNNCIKIKFDYKLELLLYISTKRDDLNEINFILENHIVKKIYDIDKIYDGERWIYKINKDIGIFANQFVDFSLKLYFSSDITETDKKDMILCVKYIDNFKYLISELYNKNDVETKNLLYENMLTWHDGIDDDDDN